MIRFDRVSAFVSLLYLFAETISREEETINREEEAMVVRQKIMA